MNKQIRVKLTHGSARVDNNCSEETLKALDEMSKIAYEMESKPLNIDRVSKCDTFEQSKISLHPGKCDRCMRPFDEH